MQDPPARRSRRSVGSVQAHRGWEGVVAAGLPRLGGAFGPLQYPTVPLSVLPELAAGLAENMSRLVPRKRRAGDGASDTAGPTSVPRTPFGGREGAGSMLRGRSDRVGRPG